MLSFTENEDFNRLDAHFKHTDAPLAATLRRTAAILPPNTVTLRELLELVGEQGLLLFCAMLTLPFLFPVSIPGVSTVFGLVIILIGIGVTLNRVPWLPQRLMGRTFGRDAIAAMLERGATSVDRLERWVKPRFGRMTIGAVVTQLNGAALTLGGVLLLFPLSFIPFSNTLPAVAILFLALGSLERDGYLVVAGYLGLLLTVVYFSGLAVAAVMGGQALFF